MYVVVLFKPCKSLLLREILTLAFVMCAGDATASKLRTARITSGTCSEHSSPRHIQHTSVNHVDWFSLVSFMLNLSSQDDDTDW